MAAYKRSVIVWNKTSFDEIPSSALDEIKNKKDTMQSAGTMYDQDEQFSDETTVTVVHKFTTQESANEWASFIDGIATTNNLVKISSRIVNVSRP